MIKMLDLRRVINKCTEMETLVGNYFKLRIHEVKFNFSLPLSFT